MLHSMMLITLTGVTTMTIIPSKSECETMLAALNSRAYKAISCSLGYFDQPTLQTFLRVHALREVKNAVAQEKAWLKKDVLIPMKTVHQLISC
jgi:hypothetical protein